MYSLFSFRRYSCVGSFCFLVPDRLTRKEDAYPSEGVTSLRRSQNHLRKKKNRTIIETTDATKHDQNPSRIPWEEACITQYMCRTRVFTRI
jgi:hypothetical protein